MWENADVSNAPIASHVRWNAACGTQYGVRYAVHTHLTTVAGGEVCNHGDGSALQLAEATLR